MTLLWIVLIPAIGGVLAGFAGRAGRDVPRGIALATLILTGFMLWMAAAGGGHVALPDGWDWMRVWKVSWIPQLGIHLEFGLDGLSLVLCALTVLLGIMAVVTSWTEIQERSGFFHFNLLWSLAGVFGVFLALDLFLFFFFWELMLVPMYFLIAIWGHERRTYAAIKFFIFTQASGLLMLAAILGLAYAHYASTGVFTFDYFALLHTPLGGSLSFWLMLGFFLAFAVKLPAFPFHTWLPDAHTEAPTAGSVILAGVLLKTGAYGLLRFAVPLFPSASAAFAPIAMGLGVLGILYGAMLAFAQTDLKRLVAYSSVSHLGFVLLAVYALNRIAFQGAVMQMLAHGLSTGALFMLVGSLQQRLHTREMADMGGFWGSAPRMASIALFFAMASLGLPGLGNFVGEFLSLLGTYQRNHAYAAVAVVGLVTAVIYSLWLIQKTFHGPARDAEPLTDFSGRELGASVVLAALLVWLGLFPQTLFDIAKPPVSPPPQASVAAQHKESGTLPRAGVRDTACDGRKPRGGFSAVESVVSGRTPCPGVAPALADRSHQSVVLGR